MTNRKLVVPGIYRHFKNKFYCTIGTSTPANNLNKLKPHCEFEAYHIENMQVITVVPTGEQLYNHDDSVTNDTLVLYKSLYDDTGIYATTIESFLALVEDEASDQDFQMEIKGGLFKENILDMLQENNLLNNEDRGYLKKAEREDDYSLFNDYGDLHSAYMWDEEDFDYNFSGDFGRYLTMCLFRFLGYSVEDV